MKRYQRVFTEKPIHPKTAIILQRLPINNECQLVQKQQGLPESKCQETFHGIREAIREHLHNYLLSHPCVSCGETDPVVLDFTAFSAAIAQMVTRVTSIERIEEELKKTEVLCANCHRKLTAKKRGWFRGAKVRGIINQTKKGGVRSAPGVLW